MSPSRTAVWKSFSSKVTLVSVLVGGVGEEEGEEEEEEEEEGGGATPLLRGVAGGARRTRMGSSACCVFCEESEAREEVCVCVWKGEKKRRA